MALSIFLAKLFGLYLIIISIILITHRVTLRELFKAVIARPEFIIFASFLNIILGLALIIGHNIWVPDWRVIITIFGWLMLIRGIVNIYYPKFAESSIKIFENNVYYAILVVIYFLIGIYLAYVGFFP